MYKKSLNKKKVFMSVLCAILIVSSLSVMAGSVSTNFGEGTSSALAKVYTITGGAKAETIPVSSAVDVSTKVKIVDAYGYTPGWSYGTTWAYQSTAGLTNPSSISSYHWCGAYGLPLGCNY